MNSECDWCGEGIYKDDKTWDYEYYSPTTGKYYVFTYHLECFKEERKTLVDQSIYE